MVFGPYLGPVEMSVLGHLSHRFGEVRQLRREPRFIISLVARLLRYLQDLKPKAFLGRVPLEVQPFEEARLAKC